MKIKILNKKIISVSHQPMLAAMFYRAASFEFLSNHLFCSLGAATRTPPPPVFVDDNQTTSPG
jgi:hypothetical protein